MISELWLRDLGAAAPHHFFCRELRLRPRPLDGRERPERQVAEARFGWLLPWY